MCAVGQAFQFLEFFAGMAHCTKRVQAASYSAAGIDVSYSKHLGELAQNPMDMTTPSGFGYLVHIINRHVVFFYREDHTQSCDFRCCRGWPSGWFYTAARIPSLWSWLLCAQVSLLSTREQTVAQPSCPMGIPRRSMCVWEILYWRGVLHADLCM